MSEHKHYDFLGAVVILLLSGAVIFGSIKLYTDAGEPMYLSPGLMPLILGISLLLCGILYLIGSLKNGGLKARLAEIKAWAAMLTKDEATRSMITGVAIMAVYVFILMHFLPFWIASLLFMAGLMFYLKATTPVRILLLSTAAVGGIVLLFQVLFRVPLP